MFQGSFRDGAVLDEIFREQIQAVFHLASIGHYGLVGVSERNSILEISNINQLTGKSGRGVPIQCARNRGAD